MEGIIVNFRGSKRTKKFNHLIINVNQIKGLIDKEVVWKSEKGKEIKGKIVKEHGKHAVRAIFERGLPGQALGNKVEIK